MKKALFIFFALAVMASLTACSGSERIKNMTIVQGLGLDLDGGKITATVQYLDLYKGSGKNEEIGGNITATVTAEGKDIASAVRNAEKKLPDKLFFGQNKIIVISDEFINGRERELRTYLVNNTESRPDVYIIRSRGKASDVIKEAQKDTRVPADSVYKQLKKNKKAVTCSQYLAGKGLYYY